MKAFAKTLCFRAIFFKVLILLRKFLLFLVKRYCPNTLAHQRQLKENKKMNKMDQL